MHTSASTGELGGFRLWRNAGSPGDALRPRISLADHQPGELPRVTSGDVERGDRSGPAAGSSFDRRSRKTSGILWEMEDDGAAPRRTISPDAPENSWSISAGGQDRRRLVQDQDVAPR